MKNEPKKVLLSILLLFFAAGYAVLSNAHCLDNVVDGTKISLNHPSNLQFDTYILSCPIGAVGLYGRIGKQSGSGSVSMEISSPRSGGAYTSITDFTTTPSFCTFAGDINIGAVSAPLLPAGPGIYQITVSKDTVMSIEYDMAFFCMHYDIPTELSNVPDALDPGVTEVNLIQNH